MLNRLKLETTQIAWDHKTTSIETIFRAWRKVTPGSTHHLVIQDDATFPRDLVQGAEEVCGYLPYDAISLFSASWKGHDEAQKNGAAWIAANKTGIGALAVILPVNIIEPWIDWHYSTEGGRACMTASSIDTDDDTSLRLFLARQNKRVHFTAPSLVQHAGINKINPYFNSNLGHSNFSGGRPYLAKWYVGDNGTACGINWSQGLQVKK